MLRSLSGCDGRAGVKDDWNAAINEKVSEGGTAQLRS